MGLDMSAWATKREITSPVDFDADEQGDDKELACWRKHPNLHGWMEKLYRAKGGAAEEFNCVALQLTSEDLDALKQAVETDSLPTTSGFFFGVSDPARDRPGDLVFIAKAHAALHDGYSVYYHSWW